MNRAAIPEPDLDNLLKRTLKDDLPPEAEARMGRQFLRLKSSLDRTERLLEPNGWLWMRGPFGKEILAVASAAMMILGLVMQLSGSQSALAHSIEQLKVIVTISAGLNRASSMDCAVLKPRAGGEQTSYRVRWRAIGDVRVDMDSGDGAETLWISNETVSIGGPGGGDVRSMSINTMTPGPVWQPALEFMSPKILARNLGEHYGLMQSGGRSNAGTNEFLIVGREGRQDVEITIDAKTYLPKVLKKYAHDSNRTNGARNCIMQARFLWNQPIPTELFSPRSIPGADQR
jgi:hypothetical protein